ncbi:MAG: tetratricopeptide repeat protein [Elusimicrobiales bacterium]|nr:tetratricopeptide repeat protein [Elusimicrobiales bacterium]
MANLSRLLQRALAFLAGVPLPLLLCVIVFTVFSGTLGNGFVDWDDVQYVLANPALRGSWLDALGFSPGYYHPLTTLTYKAEYVLFGPVPLVFHLTSLALHLAVCVSSFYLLTALGAHRQAAFIGALLFGVHPIHAEPVAWVSGRKELLWALFSCWALGFYLRFTATDRKRFYAGALACTLLAVLSKPFAVVLPGVFLLADLYLARKPNFRLLLEKVPFLLVALPVMTLSTAAPDFLLTTGKTSFSLLGTSISAALSLVFYAQKLIVPVNLSALYPQAAAAITLAGLLAVGAFTALVWYAVRRTAAADPRPDDGLGRKALFGFGFFLLTLLPALLVSPPADRYVYLPALGLCFLYGELVVRLYGVFPRRFVLAAVAAHLLLLSAGSAGRVRVWEKGMTLWNDVLGKYPGQQVAHYGRGNAFAAEGRYPEALQDLGRCLELSPRQWKAHSNRGRIFSELKEYDKALAEFSAALAIAPREPRLLLNRGNTYLLKGDHARALADYDQALALAPDFAPALQNRRLAESEAAALRRKKP